MPTIFIKRTVNFFLIRLKNSHKKKNTENPFLLIKSLFKPKKITHNFEIVSFETKIIQVEKITVTLKFDCTKSKMLKFKLYDRFVKRCETFC